MARKCSHCGRIGHNSRTCNIHINKLGAASAAVSRSCSTTTSTSYLPSNSINNNFTSNCSSTSTTTIAPSTGGLKLFGIQLTNHRNLNPLICSSSFSSNTCSNNFSTLGCGNAFTAMRKSFSLDSFHPAARCTSPSSSSKSLSPTSSFTANSTSRRIHVEEILDYRSSSAAAIGYLSDGLITRSQERKKGVPWTEEEHRTFLIGLEKLGKGDWRGISKKFVPTRTPTQVASHAQKYFLRQATLNKKRRSSLFDDAIANATRINNATTITGSSGMTTIFPKMNITVKTPHAAFQDSLHGDDEVTHVEQFHLQPTTTKYSKSWQVRDLCLGGPNSPTRPATSSSSSVPPPRPTRSTTISDHQHQAPSPGHDLQLTLRVPGLPPTPRESTKHSVLVGTV